MTHAASFREIMGRESDMAPATWDQVISAVADYHSRKSLSGSLLPHIKQMADAQVPTDIHEIAMHRLEIFLFGDAPLVRYLIEQGLDLTLRFGRYIGQMGIEGSLTRIGAGRGATPRDIAAVMVSPLEKLAVACTTPTRLAGALRCAPDVMALVALLPTKLRRLAVDSTVQP